MAADGDDGGAMGHLGFPAFAGDGIESITITEK